MVFLISYTLRDDYYRGAHRAQIEQAIRTISPTHWQTQKSEWLLETEHSERVIAERLIPLTYVGDRLLVTRIFPTWAATGLTDEQLAWLRGRNFGSLADAISVFLPAPLQALSKLGRSV